jgi:hypothetical protein
MPISIKWFPPSWIQIRTLKKLIVIDPAYLKTYFKDYPKRIEFSSWPDPIDGLPVQAYNTEQGSSTRKLHQLGEGVGYLIMIEQDDLSCRGYRFHTRDARTRTGRCGIASYRWDIYDG